MFLGRMLSGSDPLFKHLNGFCCHLVPSSSSVFWNWNEQVEFSRLPLVERRWGALLLERFWSISSTFVHRSQSTARILLWSAHGIVPEFRSEKKRTRIRTSIGLSWSYRIFTSLDRYWTDCKAIASALTTYGEGMVLLFAFDSYPKRWMGRKNDRTDGGHWSEWNRKLAQIMRPKSAETTGRVELFLLCCSFRRSCECECTPVSARPPPCRTETELRKAMAPYQSQQSGCWHLARSIT